MSRTVLVVDDDALVLMGTASMLEDLGYAVVEANSGRRALEILRGGAKVDLVVTDHAMPGMTGIQLSSEVNGLRPGLPVVLATGYAELPDGIETELPRLAKPFNQEMLARTIAGVLTTVRPQGNVVSLRQR